MYDPDETSLILTLASAGGCSLNEKKGTNWVQEGGGLPNYICKIAKELKKGGKSTSQAIAIAVSQVKKWAAGGEDVKADTKAKAARALAQWEALKAKSKGKKVVKTTSDQGDYIFLANFDVGEFNTEIVRRAFERQQRLARDAWHAAHPQPQGPVDPYSDTTPAPDSPPYMWITELWTAHIIVEAEGRWLRIPYVVKGEDVVFGVPERVVLAYIDAPTEEYVEDDLDEDEIKHLVGLANKNASALSLVMSLTPKG